MIKRLMLLLIRFYQKAISPLFPPRCRFYPTCSLLLLSGLARCGAVILRCGAS